MNLRIEYIDAMRGLAMVMVVICHFFTWSFHCYNPLYMNVNNTLQIPLFFLVGGFFAPHMLRQSFIKAIRDKFVRLVVPAILMMSLFLWVFNLNYVSALFDQFKQGYWFTFVMFGYAVIYIIVSLISKRLQLSDKAADCLHLFVGVLVTYIVLAINGLLAKYPVLVLLSIAEYNNYFFYALGAVLFARRNYLFNALKNRFLLGGVFYSSSSGKLPLPNMARIRFGTERVSPIYASCRLR